MKKEFVIYTKMLDIVIWLFQKIIKFPQKQRFVVGQQIEISALTCLRYIIEANNAGAGPVALEKLTALNVELEMLRSLLRVAFEVGFMSGKSLGFITSQIDEVGRMRGGWARHYVTTSQALPEKPYEQACTWVVTL